MAPRSFKKFVIAVSGTFPGYKQDLTVQSSSSALANEAEPSITVADVKALVEDRGATFVTTVNDQCTHLITTEKDVEKKSAKFRAASESTNCQIVSLEWLLESIKAKKPLPEKNHTPGSGQVPAAQNGQKGNDKRTEKTGDKRAVKEEDTNQDDDNKKQKDSQRTSFKPLNVPVDEEFLAEHNMISDMDFSNPEVYIDANGLIWDATLNQTVSAKNNNKFYRLQILFSKSDSKYITWSRWGRVGERGQSALLGDGSLSAATYLFQRKFKEKSGLKWEDRLGNPKAGKYTFIERNYEEDEDEEEPVKKENGDDQKPKVESALSKPLQKLMSFIFNADHFLSAMASMSYDAQKLPLGKLSDRTLKAGFSILKELSELITTPDLANSRYGVGYATATENLSNRYFTTIPHAFGRNRPPILSSDAQIKKEIELLEALTDMDVANEIMKDSKAAEINELDRQFQSLGMEEMTRLDPKSTEYSELATYLSNSRGATHSLDYSVIDIFRIERKGENDRFMSSSFANLKNSDRRLLWHGSRSTNFGGILSQGLRIAPPEAPVNGYMFGKGVYLADTSSKSANYCCPYNSANMGLLLLCDVELGTPMLELYNSDYMACENAHKAGKIATLGQGQSIPGAWKDAGCLNPTLQGVKMPDVSAALGNNDQAWLQYNEYIVYDVAQIRQRYLFYVHMR
ncbi:uncharacterized protein N7459_002286 [Penicillium hispanicum]|uniref:uncharacterized protein n=1 Tax=Penicillium hispanicum TaxID=1080232 RepID=UPI00254103B2|nr:uncharacterized protein N7459_002286 [Penicillium hispanicum]KAJ5591917.1 hypothetical protein N7459_002286 [Penicillium hispanicum]